MPKKKYWGIHAEPNRHGRLRWYFRPDRKRPRIRLPDSYGSAEFEAAYRAAVGGQPLPVAPGQGLAQARKASRGKLGWLIRLYLQSGEFDAYRPATKRQRISILERLAEDKGTVEIEDIDQAAIQASVKARTATPHMANIWLATVSNLFDWATRESLEDPLTGERGPIWDDDNPCEGVKRLPSPKADPDEEAGHPEFSDEDLATFVHAYPLGTRERRAYSVFLYTGLRVGDAARLGKQHRQRDGTIKIRTEKSGFKTEVNIEIVPPLQRALDAGPHGRPEVLNFITGAHGKAMAKNRLGKWFAERCRAIGLDRSAHGLRKASARLYAEAGASEERLMSLFGWKDPKMAHFYVRRANRKKMAIDAQRSMDWDEIENGFTRTHVLGAGTSV
jgi:integrase